MPTVSQVDRATIIRVFSEPVTWLVGITIVMVLFVGLMRPRRPGARGETAVARRLRRYCAEVANDVILRDGRGGLTQIDHLALTSEGLLVVETKDFGGLIFGQTHDRTWTQCIGRQKRRFENPLRQNYGHVKAIEALVPGGPVAGLVVFTDRAWFPKGLPQGVITLSLLRQALPLANTHSIRAEQRAAWETVMSQVLTDRLSRDAHLVIAQRRERGW